jgi:signal transduction histidine kinase
MPGSLLEGQLDFLWALHALALFFVALFSTYLFMKWHALSNLWMGLFSLSQAAFLISSIASLATDNLAISIHLGGAFQSFAFFSLSSFGFSLMSLSQRRRLLGQGIVALMLIVAAVASTRDHYWGWIGREIVVPFLVGGITLFGLKRRPFQPPFKAAALFFVFYIILLTAVPGAWYIYYSNPTREVLSTSLSPVLSLAQACTCAVMTLALFLHPLSYKNYRTVLVKYHPHVIGIALVVFAICSCYFLVEKLGDTTAERLKRELYLRITAVGDVIDPAMLLPLKGDRADVDNPVYKEMLHKLRKVRNRNSDLRFVYLVKRRSSDNEIIIVMDTEPTTSKDYAAPGEVYKEAPQALRTIFDSRTSGLVGPYKDRWGTWLSGFCPVKDEFGSVLGVVGMDIDAYVYRQSVAEIRIIGIVVTWLTALLAGGVGVILKKGQDLKASNLRLEREIQERRAAYAALVESERQYRMAKSVQMQTINILSDRLVVLDNEKEIRKELASLIQNWLPIKKVFVLSETQLSSNSRFDPGSSSMEPSWHPYEDKGTCLMHPLLSSKLFLGWIVLVPISRSTLEEVVDPVLLALLSKLAAVAIHKARTLTEMERLRQADMHAVKKEKAYALETLAAEVAHEIQYSINYFKALLDAMRADEIPGMEELVLGADELARLDRMLATLRRQRHPVTETRPTDVLPILNRAAQLIRELLDAKQIVPRFEVPEHLQVFADEDSLLQLSVNLLRNAVEAVSFGGALGVRFILERKHGVFEFYDDGPGIPDHEAKDLFKPWVSHKKNGSGLGLTVCQRIARSFEWSLRVENRPVGTCFAVHIPAAGIVSTQNTGVRRHDEHDLSYSG